MSILIPSTAITARKIMQEIMRGRYATTELVPFLKHYQRQSPSAKILLGFLEAIKSTATFTINSQDYTLPLVDLAGTGGDGLHTVNISTLAGLFCAATGLVTVAKYGNKAASGICGSMDVLEEIGLDLTANKTATNDKLLSHHFAPLFARTLYPGAKHVAEARSLVHGPTIFNTLFPLARPVNGQQQFVLGVADKTQIEQFVDLYVQQPMVRCAIVRGENGLDEISTSGNGLTDCTIIDSGKTYSVTIDCQKTFGFTPTDLSLLQIKNKTAAVQLFLKSCDPQQKNKQLDAIRQAVYANAALALHLALEPGKIKTTRLQNYFVLLENIFQEGKVLKLLHRLRPFLSAIVEIKKQEINKIKPKQNSFAKLFSTVKNNSIIIAEIKSNSPSEGVLIVGDPLRLVAQYEKAGADAISVLTDRQFFGGSAALFKKIRARTKLPLLRKEFIIDEAQVIESYELKADAVLLIVKLLKFEKLKTLITLAKQLNLVPLVEIVDETELKTALAAGAEFIGVNARDLITMVVDQDKALQVLQAIPKNKKRFLFSGIKKTSDVKKAFACGAQGLLIGTSLLKSKDPRQKLTELKESLK